MKRYGLLSMFAALVLSACGGGSVKSPDFEPELKTITISSVPAGKTTVGAGETLQFSATGTCTTQPGSAQLTEPCDVKHPVWTSDLPSAISIDANGVATGGTAAGVVHITASKDGVTSNIITLTSVGAALREVVVTPASRTIAQNSSQEFTALGIYYGSDTPQPLNTTVTWSVGGVAGDDAGIATVSPIEGATTVASSNTTLGHTHIVATSGGMSGQALLTVAQLQLQSLSITPPSASKPLGDSQQFIAEATFLLTGPDSSGETVTQSVDADWTIASPAIATGSEQPATGCDPATGPCFVALTKARGSTNVIASYTDNGVTKTATATLTVTDPVLRSLVVTPDSASIPNGTTQTFTARGVYSDTSGPITLRTGDDVTWTSSNSTVATVTAATSPSTTATAKAVGTTTIKATRGTLSDTASLEVTPAVLVSLDHVEPSTASITVNRTVTFQAIGKYSDGSEQPIDPALISWGSADTGTATIGLHTGVATGVAPGHTTVTASLDGATPAQTASANLTVTDEICQTQLLKSNGVVATTAPEGLCVLCSVVGPDNAIDDDIATFTTISVPVALNDSAETLTLTAESHPPLYTVPFAAGSKPGFVISRPTGPLVLAEVQSQVVVSTLLDGAVQESSGPDTPLRVNLLGLPLIGDAEEGLVTLTTTLPFDAVRLSLKSGTASALTDVRVSQACASTLPPVPTTALQHVTRIEATSDSIETGAAARYTAYGEYADGVEREIQDADIVWSSSAPAVASIEGNGLATGLTPGETVITATLKTGVASEETDVDARRASKTLKVNAAVCTTPFLASGGATVSNATGGLCILCSVTDQSNIIDASRQTFGTITVPIGLLGASKSVTVSKSSSAASFPAGGNAGFVIGRPSSNLLLAELVSQITVSTLSGGVVQESSGPTIPLRLDLLGLTLVDGVDSGLLSVKTTKPYDAIRLTFGSGLASALTSLQVYQACAVATPPTP